MQFTVSLVKSSLLLQSAFATNALPLILAVGKISEMSYFLNFFLYYAKQLINNIITIISHNSAPTNKQNNNSLLLERGVLGIEDVGGQPIIRTGEFFEARKALGGWKVMVRGLSQENMGDKARCPCLAPGGYP